MSEPEPSRLDMELELIGAMYPEQASYASKARELKFTHHGALLQLRLPASYPESGLPDVIAAIDASKNDLRADTKSAINELNLTEGEEALDAIIAVFQQVLEDNKSAQNVTEGALGVKRGSSNTSKTVIIWLHHLLALTKRKLALSPSNVSGITKPGYPGIMIFSGDSFAVTQHVNTLKAENWQAFQVRYEEEEMWLFAHGKGVREVETMAEVVKELQLLGGMTGVVEQGERQKQEFLKAAGIK